MNRIIQILTFTLYTTLCFSQNDTIYLHQNYILLDDEKLNLVNREGGKTGKWVEYKIVFPDDFVPMYLSGSSCGNKDYSETIEYEYRSLREGEYEKIHVLQREEIDTIENKMYYREYYKEIHSKIPPKLYRIKGVGSYMNSLKQGIWEYFYRTGESKKKINYENGIPKCDFNIYRENGTLMIRFVKVNDSVWEVSKYNENEVVFETIRDKLEKFNGLY